MAGAYRRTRQQRNCPQVGSARDPGLRNVRRNTDPQLKFRQGIDPCSFVQVQKVLAHPPLVLLTKRSVRRLRLSLGLRSVSQPGPTGKRRCVEFKTIRELSESLSFRVCSATM